MSNGQIIKAFKPINDVKISNIQAEIIYDIKEVFKSNVREKVKQEEEPVVQLKEKEFNSQLKQAFDEGVQIGLKKQKDIIKQQLQDTFKLLETIKQAIESKGQDIILESEKIILNLSIAIAKKIIHKELEIDKTIVVNVIREALKKVSSIEKNIILHLNPVDKKEIEMAGDDLEEKPDFLNNVEIFPDSRIKKGGCLVETNYSTIDATLETQIDEITKEIFKAFNDD